MLAPGGPAAAAIVGAAVRKPLAARGFRFCQYSPGEGLLKLGRPNASVSIDARLFCFALGNGVLTAAELHRGI